MLEFNLNRNMGREIGYCCYKIIYELQRYTSRNEENLKKNLTIVASKIAFNI